MALLSTLTAKGQLRRTFSIPDGDLQKYNEVKIEESKLAQPGETVPGAENAIALEAGTPGADVHAYGGWCRCYFKLRGVYFYKDQSCVWPCPPII